MDGAHGEACELLRGTMHDRQSPIIYPVLPMCFAVLRQQEQL